MSRLVVATLIWDANEHTKSFSTMYDERWVRRLYDGFARNLTRDFEFVLYTDRPRDIGRQVTLRKIAAERPDYSSCIQPYELDRPMILVGLDTVVVGNCDHLADYALTADTLAVPRDPYFPDRVCNGVALVPAGQRARMWDAFDGKTNDMDWIRANPHNVLDDVFPGACESYKGFVKHFGLEDGITRIVYFHGEEKADELAADPDPRFDWVREHWGAPLGAEERV